MPRTRTAICFFLACLLSSAAAASRPYADDWRARPVADAGHAPRVALLIGNSNYAARPLHGPRQDVPALGRLLQLAGFEVMRVDDATRAEILEALGAMQRRLGRTGTALFYFAGHGMQTSSGIYLLPVDGETSSADSVHRTAVSIVTVIKQLVEHRAGTASLVIADTCLNKPFAANGPASAPGSRAYSAVLPPQTLLALSASAGGVALDSDGEQGIYARELIRALSQPGLSAEAIFRHVRVAVSRRTGGLQQPWTLSTLDPGFRLASSYETDTPAFSRAPPLPAAQLLAMETRGILPKDGEAQYELEFWQSIKNSKDAADYEAYLEAYPDGKFAPLAKSRAARYRKSSSRTAASAAPVALEKMDADYEVVKTANLRQAPSPKSKQLGRLSKGARVRVTGRVKGKEWYQVKAAGGSAFVYAPLLRKPAAAAAPEPRPQPAAKAPPPATPVAPPASKNKFEVTRDCPECPDMVTLPAGRFTMGDRRGDRSEKPEHKVSIGRPFAIGVYEVTVGQWNACHRAGACGFAAAGADDMPARDISWSDASDYVQWLGRSTGKKYRLPTEAEWEYAARAGTATRFWWGDDIGRGHADCKDCGGDWNRKTPATVAAYAPNPFGLYGTSGGVWEWVADCWYKSHKGAPQDGSARNRGDCRENVIRGGAWRNDSSYVHSASRFKYDSNVRYILNGFRVAKTLE